VKAIGSKRVRLQEVVNWIHDAALDPELWPAAVQRASAYCNSSMGILVWLDLRQSGPAIATSTLPHDAVRTYSSDFFLSDPGYRFHSTHPADTVSLNTDWESAESYRNSELYRNFLARVDIEDRAAVVVLRDPNHFAIFGLGRGHLEDPYNRALLHALSDLSPHFRQAIRVSDRLRRSEADKAALTSVLDRIEDGVILLDGALRVVFTNGVAENLVAHNALTIHHGKLSAPLHENSIMLNDLLRRVVRTSEGTGTDSGGTMALHDEDGVIRATLAASPMRTEHVGERFGLNPVRAVVFVREAREQSTSSAETLMTLFRLTPAESQVALRLAQGQSLKDIADARGLGKDTVRSQLRAVFDKTGVRRQTDLMKVLLTLPRERMTGHGTLQN
jgi:DNA-binding CsgD family transcriptional regulator/PAS domain-containing protein